VAVEALCLSTTACVSLGIGCGAAVCWHGGVCVDGGALTSTAEAGAVRRSRNRHRCRVRWAYYVWPEPDPLPEPRHTSIDFVRSPDGGTNTMTNTDLTNTNEMTATEEMTVRIDEMLAVLVNRDVVSAAEITDLLLDLRPLVQRTEQALDLAVRL